MNLSKHDFYAWLEQEIRASRNQYEARHEGHGLQCFACMLYLFGNTAINDLMNGELSQLKARSDWSSRKFRDAFLVQVHKSFRQYDVSQSLKREQNGYLDSLFWNFWHVSDIPCTLIGKAYDHFANLKPDEE